MRTSRRTLITTPYDRLRIATNALLVEVERLTQQAIRDEIARLRPAFPEVTDAEAERLAAHFEELHAFEIGSGHGLPV